MIDFFRSHKQVRDLQGHQSRVGCVAWKGHVLTSGSKDRAIINHDGSTKLFH